MKKTIHVPEQTPLKLPNGTVGLSFSTGADSTLLLYLLMSQTDLPVHLFQVTSGWLENCELPLAAGILSWMSDRFPDRDITHTIRYSQDSNHQRTILFEEPRRALYELGTISSFLTGLTLSPSREIQQEIFPGVLNEQIYKMRDPEIKHDIQLGNRWYSPMRNLNKQQVYQTYTNLQILDLWALTRSCTRSADPCGECWWCTERAWAEQINNANP